MSSNTSSIATSSAKSSMDQASRASTASEHHPPFNPAPPVAPFAAGKSARPASEIFFANAQHPLPETKHIDRWFESLSQFEDMLEDMAKVSLDPVFKDELNAIDQWFSVLLEPERTAALYSLMQHCSDLQVRFFITILQQMLRMDQDPDAAEVADSSAGQNTERHSISGQAAYGKHHAQQPHLHQHGPMRMSYDSANPYASGTALRAGAAASMLSGSPGLQRTAGWVHNNTANLSSDNLLVGGAGKFASEQQRPKSSSHDADIGADWRVNRPGSVVASPTADQFPPQAQLGIGAVGSSRRQSSNLLAQQAMTPRASVDMEPKDFRWSSLTDSLEPFGGIGQDAGSSALTHTLEANMNRTSGIAARRSVSSRLSIAVKSPRDTMQAQQHVAASLAQLTMGGSNAGSSPLSSTFAQQQQQYQNRSLYAQNPGGSPLYHPAGGARVHGAANGQQAAGSGTPSRQTFARNASHGSSIHHQPLTHSPAGLKPQQQPQIQQPQQQPQQQQQQEVVDLELVKDIPAWLRSLRLHKYTDCFADMSWMEVVALNDEQLQAKGVAALGARRKMLKVFEAVLGELGKGR
ncbi:Flap-structured DNA-binding and RNA-binding protein [Coemansia spiralis]|uniref:RNA-binding protein VTS1 n=2 Tax=Coemansia TaxID=4863 RepID=A0A9W8G6W9_9FUNG|nr:Flap-structured DNA-binding and RNA-binding protein [Coemansia umbellata]KAJ2620823.1 Flap-structured DNA-binding and RNA-binding protein [Coemansia sp. RSA 1358]KAJ2675249.1 Flap-structured DNA-binding and RNA-binding protein [Coemansia spiralis]